MTDILALRGCRVLRGYLDRSAQETLVDRLRLLLTKAPLFQPVTPRGQPMSVRMSAAGQFGWISDAKGYRYSATHPQGMPWPAIPQQILTLWDALSGVARQPECCLINWYAASARMSLHQDRDESDLTMPVVSISLGDEGLFRIGGTERKGSTESLWLQSGDVLVLEGASRLAYHGVDRIRPGSSTLLPNGGRINLTLRVVT
ncbi:alpha-ketoglutarate-dependent dioxygenase AlkB [Puniceibacterium sp. IMCC21224]|uniref:alpha-ketoglutarate-dependent dioxygenase AlkB family protein n=1 Tax=Puniceibacterium sp. IMCC21224 TaxID=1618204 RepID=UPI00064E1047|nr:alpha-ketoglutarate-dependent dioxygenase AlkB [Puniceibacterium sp. IMCC21224]KMK65534.1 alkylated DNA repair protein [Puniceibacterium sp. IMCC21224]